jgi:hypothetical protein
MNSKSPWMARSAKLMQYRRHNNTSNTLLTAVRLKWRLDEEEGQRRAVQTTSKQTNRVCTRTANIAEETLQGASLALNTHTMPGPQQFHQMRVRLNC